MAYDDQSFIQKLRQNQILRPEGQGLPSPLIGMPDFYREGPQQFNGRQQELIVPPPGMVKWHRQPGDANPVAPVEKPMGTAWIPGAADINAARMVLGETPKDEQQRKLELQNPKNLLALGGLNIKSRAQDLREKVEAGKATDAEKQEYAKELIGLRGDVSSRQIGERGEIQKDLLDTRGSQATGLQNLRGEQNTNLQNLRGNQRLNEIAQTALGKSQGGGDVLSPSQERNQTNNNISRIIMEQPELAKFLVKDPNTGQYSISDDANETTRNLIISKVNGSSSGDMNLSSSTIKTSSGTPTSTTPKANMTLPSQSKYKVTVK